MRFARSPEFAAEGGFSSVGGYKMAPNNPFLTDVDSFDKGRKLFQQGLLTESVLAIEAECTRRPGKEQTPPTSALATVRSKGAPFAASAARASGKTVPPPSYSSAALREIVKEKDVVSWCNWPVGHNNKRATTLLPVVINNSHGLWVRMRGFI